MRMTFKIVFIFLLLLIYCFAFQGNRGLFEPDEGRYSAVALQMIKSNDWLHPRTHPARAHWAKPPLAYWAIAGSLMTFGNNEFSVRFPNALSFFLSIVICLFLGKVFTPKRPWLVSLVFGMFLFPSTMCNGATTDYLLMMWETLAVCFFAGAYWGHGGKHTLTTIMLMWASFGLAFLTKGPPGLLPLFAIIIFLRSHRPQNSTFRMFWIFGLPVMVLIGGSWFFTIIAQNSALGRYF